MRVPLSRLAALLLAAAGLLAASGCSSDPALSHASAGEWNSYYENTLLPTGGFSFKTVNYLRSNQLYAQLRKDPSALLRTLESYRKHFSSTAVREMMADICFNVAESLSSSPDRALPYYLSAAVYAYTLLFPEHGCEEATPDKFDPSNCLLLLRYNQAAGRIFEYIRARKLLKSDSFELTDATGGRVNFQKSFSALPFPQEAYDDFVPCSCYTVKNLNLVNQRFGIGIPLIAWTSRKAVPRGPVKMPERLPLPATAVLHFRTQEGKRFIQARFAYYDTCVSETVRMEDGPVPLAFDFTTPIAGLFSALERDNLIRYMLNPVLGGKTGGLYLLEPYDPHKIPVVFIHGLMSGPATWTAMINMLRTSAAIRRNCQFWFYKYSSGNPVLSSAQTLAGALRAAEHQLAVTPEAENSFRRMILVGHSMGGLIVRTVLQDDEHYCLEKLTGQKWETLAAGLPEEERAALEKQFIRKLPFVKRIVLMAVPHRGSAMAKWSVARFVSSLVKIPRDIAHRSGKLLTSLLVRSGKMSPDWEGELTYTGIDNLDPDNVFIRLIADSPFASGIPRHSIIGNREAGDAPGGTDGIVPYSSAHIDGVESELIVKSGHSVHCSPRAVRELMRILLVHLRTASKDGFQLRKDEPFPALPADLPSLPPRTSAGR